jgi:uncharacterized protein YdhG (YjbR/CyaY superfamily)
MESAKKKPESIDDYISSFPKDIAVTLKEMRKIIREAAPQAEEVISYGMPAFKLQGILVYFAGYKGHIGFYPTGSGIKAFKSELDKYKTSPGTVQFPLDKPLPKSLIKRMVKFRVKEDLEKVKEKKKK